MWLFTVFGFYSTSAKTFGGKRIIEVRARTRRHLENLLSAFKSELKGCKIIVTPDNDYRFRIRVAHEVWPPVVAKLAEAQDWSNFKAEVARVTTARGESAEYEHALHEVWHVMRRLQDAPKKRWQDEDWDSLFTKK